MKLTVVTISYNVKYFLEQCLNSLEQAARNIDHEVIVVDNASDDGSTEYITARFPKVKWIASDVNHGFSRANNIAFEQARGKYILMLNPDTIVTREAIEGCLDFMEKHPEAGATGVKMLNKDGNFALESRRGIVTPWVSICKATGLSKRFPKSRLFGHYYMSYLPEEEANAIEMVSGAFMFLRRSTLKKVGKLDEQFFMYWEDSDLSFRILKSGAKNYYLPHPILHYKGESSVKSKLKYRYWLYYSLQLFFRKHNFFYYILSYIPLKLTVSLLKFRIHCINPLFLGKEWETRSTEPNKRFIIIGSQESRDEICTLLSNNSMADGHKYITATDEELLNGNIDIKESNGHNHILFDTEHFTYDSILSFMQRIKGKNLKIATYSTKTKILITDGAIYNSDGLIAD